jgi:hypothetical protein
LIDSAEREYISYGKHLTCEEIEGDIRKLSAEFRGTWSEYAVKIFKNYRNPNLSNFELVYSTITEDYSYERGEKDLRKFNQLLSELYSKITGVKIKPFFLRNFCPEEVGGLTFLVGTLLGKISRGKIKFPIFINRKRAYHAPHYAFSAFHEMTHLEELYEYKANTTALKCIEKLSRVRVGRGYDLFTAKLKLEWAVSALYDKLVIKEKRLRKKEFIKKIAKLGVPKFLLDETKKDGVFRKIFISERSPAKDWKDYDFLQLYFASSYYKAKQEGLI